ncbi:MAG: Gluconate dehydratase [uncultured Chloroflexi bacterium]|uniref:Gluconate dehydratase n=1 Tax=uncultured Chloroflexota bacterium TaxID=166587 RepID=A0A6J4K4J6_9CHLR|nr:MAG: Gluconate dehydratase [uncultured Chloroflexota bacterium]
MKITKVTPWLVTAPAGARGPAWQPGRQYVFVQVDTDEGITGWGEITGTGALPNRAVVAVVREVGPFIEGEDPTRIEAIWNKIFRAMTYVGTRGITSCVVSGIDIALWDITGKARGLPIYELLGGPVRDSIALYTHFPLGDTPEEAARNVMVPVKDGVRAIKTDPFMPEWSRLRRQGLPGAYLDGGMSARGEQEGADFIAAIREAVGPDVEILIDAHAMYNVPTAIRLANRLAPYNITWFEEPVPPESYHALRQVREQVSTRICVGERLHTRFDFVPVLEQRLADFIMPDVTWTGGITELKKISTLAEAYYVPVSPHDASGPINVLAGAHVMMTVPNFYKLETIRSKMDSYDAFIQTPLDTRDGQLYVPKLPGLGLEMNLDYLRAHAEPGWGG